MTKKKWLGSMLNFLVPGLGTAYSRKVKKAIVLYVLFFVTAIGLRFVAYNFTLFLVSLTLIIGYYLFLLVVGYRDVGTDYKPVAFDKWYVYATIFVLHVALVGSIKGRTLDNLTPINFASIPTPAMEPALQVGDVLAFKKSKSVTRNDVTLFWHPDDRNTMYVKRCVGLPGDSLRIEKGIAMVNGTLSATVPLKFKYIITTDSNDFSRRILDINHIRESDFYKLSFDTYMFFLTDALANEFKKLKFVRTVELTIDNEGVRERGVFPESENFNWNSDFYGPLYIPKKGDKIELTSKNIDLYFKCIQFENESVERDSSGVRINGLATSTYQFRDSYFFMMGDNRRNSLDSRYWGFLPQELVIGKAMYLYWGRGSDRIGKEVI